MVSSEVVKDLALKSETKIVLVVIDGVGGLPDPETGRTELEAAETPHLDELAHKGICGLIDPIGRGITPGSGPAHLSLFGYDPLRYKIGRGALAAMGIGFELGHQDLAARINFATIDRDGIVTDRRARRIPTERNQELCEKLRQIEIPGVEIFVEPVKEHRAVVVFRGADLSEELTDSDPQKIGLPAREVQALSPSASKAAGIVNEFITLAKDILANEKPANMILLRGFAKHPHIPTMRDIYGLRCGAIATYPMYKGISRIVGMDVLPTGPNISDQFGTLERNFNSYDFFYLHIKATDSAGEDGDFDRKAEIIREIDSQIPRLTNLNPDVIVVTGDHSTPSLLKSHSWHPVPIIIYSKWCRPDSVSAFSESECGRGSLGRFPATEVMVLALAHALRLGKYGA